MNFNDIERLIKSHRNKPFIIDGLHTTTYSEISQNIFSLINEISFCEEKTVGIITPSGTYLREFVILLLSLLRLNAKVVVLSPREKPKRTVDTLKKINANYLMFLNDSPAYYEALKIELENIYNLAQHDFSKIVSTHLSNLYSTTISPESQEILPNQPCIIVPTSGSIGSPKNVLLSIENFLTNAQYSNRNIKFTESDTWLLSLPVFHVSGLSIIFRAIVSGGKIFIPDNNHTVYGDNFPDVITHISMVSTTLWRVLNASSSKLKEKMRNLKAILLGGGPIPGELVKKVYELGWNLYTTYGMTEMASQITTTAENDTLEHLLTSGRPLITGSVKLTDDGTIFVNGPTRFVGYLEAGKIKKPFDNEGWFDTNDIGKWTEDGYLQILGRKDNMFISAGENIFPEEIESCILETGYISRAIVIPQEDKEYGMVPVAYVELEENRPIEDLINFLKTKLPGIKIPKKIYPFPQELKTSGIKISRKSFISYITSQGENIK